MANERFPKSAGFANGSRPAPRGYRADRGGMSYREIEREMRTIRALLAPDVALNEPASGVQLFERIDTWRFPTRGGYVDCTYAVKDLPYGTEGRTRFDRDEGIFVLELACSTYTDLENEVGRARHTLFHEIGHLILHADQLLRISSIPHAQAELARTNQHRHFEDTEWQADASAAAFAMPARGLAMIETANGYLSATLISQTFRVSFEAATNRLSVFTARRSELL